jgi:L-xylulokinase
VAEQYFLGIDAGQTVVKAALHNSQLQQIAVARGHSPNQTPEARRVERSQDDLWEAAREAISRVIRDSGVSPQDIVAVGLTGHGDGLHLVDKNGGPVGPAVMAVDSRSWKEMDEILADPRRSETILRNSGQVPFLGSTGAIFLWTLRNHPEYLERAHAMLFCKDVLRLRLTGETGTDYSDAAGSFLDTHSATWSQEVLDAYQVGDWAHLMPQLHASTDVVGSVTKEASELTGLAAGTPVVAGSHDVHAAALGMGSLEEHVVTLIAGSFSINAVTTTEDNTDPRWQSRLSVETGLRMAMSTSATASTTLEWFLRQVDASDASRRDQLFQEALTVEQRDDLPIVTPYMFASPFGSVPSGGFIGLRSWHTPAHLLRATLEGIVWMHIWHVGALGDAFSWNNTARLGGGMANSPLYSQMVADALNLRVEVVGNEETGGFGSAAMAATGIGHFGHYREANAFVEVSRTHEPQPASVAYWVKRTELFRATHDALNPLWASWPGTQ